MTADTAEISIQDLESLMLAASAVTGVYNAVSAHKQDAAVMRTKDNLQQAITNANRQISNARRIKDPMEDEPPSESELNCLREIQERYRRSTNLDLDPRDPMAVSILRKRLAVMGHLTATIHWGDKTTETRAADKLVWKLTKKGEDAVAGLKLIE